MVRAASKPRPSTYSNNLVKYIACSSSNDNNNNDKEGEGEENGERKSLLLLSSQSEFHFKMKEKERELSRLTSLLLEMIFFMANLMFTLRISNKVSPFLTVPAQYLIFPFPRPCLTSFGFLVIGV